MFSIRKAAFGLTLAGAALAGVAHAGVVVSSSGPSAAQFPVGKKLDDTGSVTLKEGDIVTVLTDRGTRVIKGAGIHRLAVTGESKRSTFAVLTRQRSAQRVRTGAVRGSSTGAAERSPNLWYVDVSRSGTMCVASAGAIRLWRPDGRAGAVYRVGRDGQTVAVTFAENTRDVAWDATALPVTEGARYSIVGPDGGSTNEVNFVMLSSVPEKPEELAAQLIEKGCTNQLDLLAAAMS